MKKIIFVRHGQTDQNIIEKNASKSGSDRLEGFKEEDYPLNETGISQAKMAAEELRNCQIDAIFCSPLKRAKETAEIINEFHQAPIFIKDNLRERNSGDYVGPAFHELFDVDKNIQDGNIESIKEFIERVYAVMDEITSADYENIMIVAHGGIHHVVRTYFLKLPLEGNIRVDKVPNGGVRFYEI